MHSTGVPHDFGRNPYPSNYRNLNINTFGQVNINNTFNFDIDAMGEDEFEIGDFTPEPPQNFGLGFGPIPVPPGDNGDPVPINQGVLRSGDNSHYYVRMEGEQDKWRQPNLPLFRFGAPKDAMSQIVNIKDRVLFKVFTNLVEIIIMEKADEYDLAMAMWLISHCTGNLYINIPQETDPKRLLHIATVKKESRIKDLVYAVVGNVVRHPAHLVLETKFSTANSILDGELINKHSLNRIYAAVKNDYLEDKL